MPRFLAVSLAAFACVFIYLVATGIALPQAATVRTMFVVSSVALMLSAIATAVAVVTAARIRAQRTALQNLARSVDAALHDLTPHDERTGELPTLDAAVGKTAATEEIETLRPDADHRPIEIVAARPPAAAGRMAQDQDAAASRPAASVAGSPFRLRPLLSVATGNVAGFDVLAEASDEDGLSGSSAASDRSLVLGAIEASSRPGFAGERTPLHVNISHALLADRAELTVVVEALRRLNGTARSIVLSLPAELMEKPERHAAMLARLAASGPRLAAEGWPDSDGDVEALWRSGASFIRLPAARLLAHDDDDAHGAAAMIRVLTASGMTAIAAGVRSQADVAALAGLGVVLMTPAASHEAVHPQPGNVVGTGDAVHI